MTTIQRYILKDILAKNGKFAIKHYHKRSVKYRVLTLDRSPIVNVGFRTFSAFMREEFFKEDSIGGIKVYTITDKAINYKFKKSKNDNEK
jgi:hypothetical protein